jgi:hypothetical protein
MLWGEGAHIIWTLPKADSPTPLNDKVCGGKTFSFSRRHVVGVILEADMMKRKGKNTSKGDRELPAPR